jgi:hypothetical protein
MCKCRKSSGTSPEHPKLETIRCRFISRG